ncbi:MAG TPA: lactonase family protein [Stellaceae bacterium]|nr:lactonase family protein [Stellaceae bacterium]
MKTIKPDTLSRRQLFPLLGGAVALATVAPRSTIADSSNPFVRPPAAKARFVYVGTYTFPGTAPGGTHQSQARGIYVFRMNPSNGGLTLLQIAEISNPSYLALDPTLRHLYSVNEMTAGAVSAYVINQANGLLTPLNTLVPTNGQDTTHLSVQPSGQYLLAASYTSGNFQVFQINGDGSIGTMTDNFQSVGNGTGPNLARQEGPHAHQILTDLDGNHVFGVDLGADKVNVWNLDPGTGNLIPNTVPFAPIASGSGPRHMAFHPDRQHAYVLSELASSVTVFDYDPLRAALIWKQTISTLPPDFTGTNTTAEIRIHPNGRFLYNTNRGHNSVTMFEIEPETGELEVIGWESTRGEWPRGMNIDPSGTFLYAANQNTDSIAVFRIRPASGKLQFSTLVNTPTPVDVEFGSLA